MAKILVRADDGTEIPISINDEDRFCAWDCFTCSPSDGYGTYNLDEVIQDAIIHADYRHGEVSTDGRT